MKCTLGCLYAFGKPSGMAARPETRECYVHDHGTDDTLLILVLVISRDWSWGLRLGRLLDNNTVSLGLIHIFPSKNTLRKHHPVGKLQIMGNDLVWTNVCCRMTTSTRFCAVTRETGGGPIKSSRPGWVNEVILSVPCVGKLRGHAFSYFPGMPYFLLSWQGNRKPSTQARYTCSAVNHNRSASG